MEKKYGKLRNGLFYAGIVFAFISRFTQVLHVPHIFSFYFALAGITLIVIGLVLMLVILLNKKQKKQV